MKLLALSLLLGAPAPLFAGGPSTAGARTAFDPRVHGFDFVNSYAGDILLDVPLIGWVDLGDAPYGLCGGMSFAALDSFYAGVEVPDFGAAPDGGPPASFASGTPLRSYVYGRQTDSLRADDAFLVRRLISWIPRPIHSNWFTTGLAELTQRDFEDKIAPALDQGCPVPLSLVNADANDFLPDLTSPTLPPSGFTENHQVVALGYRRHERGPDHWDVDIYDPNYPDEIHTLHLKLRVQTARVRADGALFAGADDPDQNRRGRFRGLYRSPYEAKDAPWEHAGEGGSSTPLSKGRRGALSGVGLASSEVEEPAAAPGPADVDTLLSELEERVAGLETRAAAAVPAVLCLDVAADLSPLHATRALPAGVREVSVAIDPRGTERFRELTAVFVAVDVGEAAPPGTEMGRATQATLPGERARFRYHQELPLPAGSYRVDLLGDDRTWLSLPYRVLPSVTTSAPALAFPLAPGRAWNYDFEQVAGEGVHLVDGDVAIGSRLRAAVELRVAEVGADPASPARLELRRDGVLVSQQWWRWDARGLCVTRQAVDGETYELDPPRPLLAALGGVSAWEHGDQDVGFVQGRQWGPLQLAGPWGQGSGYVVRTEERDGPFVITAEREFVPGLGLVRERITTAHGGKLVATEELVLRGPG